MAKNLIRATTILAVRKDGRSVMGGDGQVTLGETIMKHRAVKVRTMYHDQVLVGFAGAAADAFNLFERLEGRSLFEECPLKYCDCGGTVQNCRILAVWASATETIKELLSETTVVSAAWNHPEHRFDELPDLEVKEKSPMA